MLIGTIDQECLAIELTCDLFNKEHVMMDEFQIITFSLARLFWKTSTLWFGLFNFQLFLSCKLRLTAPH